MSRYIKSYSNYVLRKEHQQVKNGSIWEHDWVTLGGTQRFTPGQTPVYSNGNFIFTINNSPSYQKKHKYGHWVISPDGNSIWTDDEVDDVNLPDTNSDVEVNEVSNDLRDFAYFGSCVELIRASIEDIIKYFPAELYFSGKVTQIVTGSTTDANPFQTVEGFIVDNDFDINLINNNVILTEFEDALRYFSLSYKDYEIISGSTKIPVNSLNIVNENVDVNCLTEGQLLNTITINGNIVIKGRFVNGERQFFHNTTIGLHIRPIQSRIDKYFKGLDGFEKVLLNRKYSPIYGNTFLTPIETDKGITFVNRKYTWPVINGWNLDISSPNYLSFFNNILSVAKILDDYYCDNIYRSMTHEAIKNFDWTYTREYNDGDEQEYVIGGTKIINLLRIYGRIFDDIKRYIDGVKFSNAITYNGQNNVPDYFLSDKLEIAGWDVSTVVKSGTENDVTDTLYSGESTGYTYTEVNNQFMKRLALCSKAIFKSKGTRHSIEMLMAMFGIDKSWYSVNEYYYTCNPITNINTINLIKSVNDSKNMSLTDEYDPYSGLLVKEFSDNGNVYLSPWFDKNAIYDGDPYFQSNGGWGSENPLPLNNGNFIYKETMPYINVVPSINELFTLGIGRIMPNDVYYVYDISNINDYNFVYDNPSLSGNPTNYFILGNGQNISDENSIINNSRNPSGWTCVTYSVNGQDKIISNDRIVYLESIISKNNGNNPHIGYGHYDMGKEFFDYLRELFKYALDNNKLSGTDAELSQYKLLGFTDINFNTPTLDPIKIRNIDVYKNICGSGIKNSKSIPSSIFLNTKLLVIENKYTGNSEFRKYFTDYILPYVEQLVPSTSIFGIKGFDANGGKYLTLSTNEVKLNDSMNPVDLKDVTLNSSGSWSSSPVSTLTNGIPSNGSEENLTFTVEKKKGEKKYGNEKITFKLTEDNSISSILNVTVSQISSSDIVFDSAMGGTKITNVVVDGLNNNPNYYIVNNISWANVIKNGNTITVTATQNNTSSQRSSTIIVYNLNDNNCYWVINVLQAGAEVSINSSCLYQSKTNNAPNCVNDVPYTGGIYYIDVEAIGGAQDYKYSFTSDILGVNITSEKVSNRLLKVIIGENSKIDDINCIFTFTHISDVTKTATTIFRLLKASGLGILINGKNEVDGTVQYVGGTVTPLFNVNAIGASKTWSIDVSTLPSWLTSIKDVNSLELIAELLSSTTSRESRITIYHNDDNSVKAYINVTQNGVGELSIVADPNELTFNSNGGSTVVSVDVYGALKNYTINSSCNWVTTENNVVGDYGDYKEYKLVVNITQYKDTTQDRTCVLTLIHNNNSNVTETVTITQEAATAYDIYATKIGETIPVISVTDIPFTQTTEANGRKFDVYVSPINTGYIVTENTAWIYTSTNNNVLTVWFDTNSSANERSSSVILKNALDTSKTHTITFTQAGAGLLFIGGKLPSDIDYTSSISMQFDAKKSAKPVDIKVNGGSAEYLIDSANALKYPWLHVSPTSGGTGQITITCDDNPDDNNRNGVVVLTHKDNPDYSFVINIQQNQGYKLTIDPNDGGNTINVSTVRDVAQSGIIKTFNIAASGGEAKYKFVGSNVDWVLGNGAPLTALSSGTSDTIFKLQVLSNDTGVVRNATIAFEHVNDSSKKVSIVINQLVVVYDVLIDGLKLLQWNEVESSNIERIFTITVSGGSMQYSIDNPVECSYNKDTGVYTEIAGQFADWVNVFNQGNSMTLDLNENGLPVIRAAKVRVKHSDKPTEVYAEVFLWQKAAVIEYKNYKIITTPTEQTYNDTGGTTNVLVKSTRDKFVNGNFIKTEFVPYKIKIEDDIPITYTNIFKVFGKEEDQTYNVEVTGKTIDMAVISLLKNDISGSENFVVWNVTSNSNWLIVSYKDDNRVTITVDENITVNDRIGILKFVQDKEDPKTIIITYNQGHYVYNITINNKTELTQTILASGSTINIEVVSKKHDSLFPTYIKDVEWTTSLDFPDWGTQTSNGGVITVNENNGSANRVGIVTYKQTEPNGISAKLTITQAYYMYVFDANGTSANGTSSVVTFDTNGETKAIVINSYCYDSISTTVYYNIGWRTEYESFVSVAPNSGNTNSSGSINVNITMSRNDSLEGGRTSTVIFRQDKSDKYVNVPLNQPLIPNVIWVEPSEDTIKTVEAIGSVFTAYANTTALTYNDVVVSKNPDDTWVSLSSPLQGDNLYGSRAVKVDITVIANNDNNREMSIIIDKK